MPSEDINKGAGSQFLCTTFERLLRSHSSPEGDVCKKKGQRTLKNLVTTDHENSLSEIRSDPSWA